jgi:hypothetical protein
MFGEAYNLVTDTSLVTYKKLPTLHAPEKQLLKSMNQPQAWKEGSGCFHSTMTDSALRSELLTTGDNT